MLTGVESEHSTKALHNFTSAPIGTVTGRCVFELETIRVLHCDMIGSDLPQESLQRADSAKEAVQLEGNPKFQVVTSKLASIVS